MEPNTLSNLEREQNWHPVEGGEGRGSCFVKDGMYEGLIIQDKTYCKQHCNDIFQK